MTEISTMPAVKENSGVIKGQQVSKKAPMIIIEQNPDTFETKTSAVGLGAATVAAVVAGKETYPQAKKLIDKGLSCLEKEKTAFIAEFNKTPKKAIAKYGLAALASIGVGAFVFKDSDKDGKLDILEALQKIVNPE